MYANGTIPIDVRRAASWHTRLLAGSLVLAAFALRVANLGAQGLWVDEGYTLDGAVQHPLRIISYKVPDLLPPEDFPLVGADEFVARQSTDIHPPLYYLSLMPWIRFAGTTEAALRFPSAIWSVLAVALVYVLARQLWEDRGAILATLLLAVSAFGIAYAQEARMYALFTFEIALALTLTARWLFAGDRSRRFGIVYALGVASALYTHYFAGFFLLSLNVLVALTVACRLWVGPRCPLPGLANLGQGLRFWVLTQLGALALFAPWAGVMLHQVSIYPGQQAPVPDWQWVVGLLWTALNAGLGLREQDGAPALAAVGAIGLAGWFLNLRGGIRQRLAALFLFGALVLPLAMYLAVLSIEPHYHPRYLLPLTIPYYVLLGGGLAALARASRLVGSVTTALVAATALSGVALYFNNVPFQKDEAREVAQSLTGRARASEAVVVDAHEPIHHYYRAPAAYAFMVNESDTPQRLSALLAGRSGAWVVQWWLSRLDAAGQVPYLLAKYGRLDLTEQWRGYRLLHYSLPVPVTAMRTDEGLRPLGVRFASGLTLVSAGYGPAEVDEAADGAVASGGVVWTAARWKLFERVTQDAKASVRIFDSAGVAVAQADTELAIDITTTKNWDIYWETTTYHVLNLPAGLAPGSYQMRASLYWKPTGELLRPERPSELTRGDAVVLGDIQVAPALQPRTPTPAEMPTRTEQPINGEITLLGYNLPLSEVAPGNEVSPLVYWRADRVPSADYTARLELRGPDGAIVTGPERPLVDGYPASRWNPGDIVRSSLAIRVRGGSNPGRYSLALQVAGPSGPVATIGMGTVQVLPAPARVASAGDPSVPLSAALGSRVKLLGYDLDRETVKPGEALSLTLYWAADDDVATPYAVFAQLLDGTPRVVAQHDGPPDSGQRPVTGWRPGEVIRDTHRIQVPGNLGVGEYDLRVGMYHPVTLERAGLAAAGADVQDNALLIRRVRVQR